MLQIQQYYQATSLEEAYAMLQKNRNNQIIGGMMWLKMQDRMIPTAIDLSALPLDSIEEQEDGFLIGANVSLRSMETDQRLHSAFDGVFSSAFQDIVGVQFRNMATLGGSVYARFGFSDVLTVLLSLDCEVITYHRGSIALEEFCKLPYERDIITHLFIKKQPMKVSFQCMRNSATDIASFNLAMSLRADQIVVAIGARPKKAIRFSFPIGTTLNQIEKDSLAHCELADNMRASEAYRKRLCLAFLQKASKEVGYAG